MTRRRILQFCGIALGLAIHAGGEAAAQRAASGSLSLTTQERMEAPGWWPTKGNAARSLYAGTAACKQCHAAIAAQQETTPMYHAASSPADSEVLRAHPSLRFEQSGHPNLQYLLSRDIGSSGAAFAVSDGAQSSSLPVVLAVGAGQLGQTFLLAKPPVSPFNGNSSYLESRLSYYTALSALDITTGHPVQTPAELEKALGRDLDHGSTVHCFRCHTTAAVAGGAFDPAGAAPGIQCEACHGPGAPHIAAEKAEQYDHASAGILNPARLSPSDSVDFCGACHRTWSDVAIEMPASIGIAAIRFQPYRLEKSRCWGGSGDERITCIACHDPHLPLVRDSAAYDSRCLACHAARGKPRARQAAACTVAAANCVSCHMPKYEVPQTHAKFTDHDIRIVRAGTGQAP